MVFDNYKFLNGTREFGYPGIPVTTGTEILNHIAQTLLNGGWVINDQINSANYLIAEGTRPNNATHKTWVKFSDDLSGNIDIQGDFYGTNTTLSPPIKKVPYDNNGNESLLWVSCKEDAGGFYIRCPFASPVETMDGGHYGFLTQSHPSDAYCAYIGLNRWDAPMEDFVMKHLGTNDIWFRAGDEFTVSSAFKNNANAAGLHTGMDYLMVHKPRGTYDAVSNQNPFSRGYHGMINRLTNNPDALPMFFYEGEAGTASQWGTFMKGNKECPNPLGRRGYHPFVISGHNNVDIGQWTEMRSNFGITRVWLGGGIGNNAMLIDMF
ncbi:hypothetical protein [Crocosphaera sp.]|uniref:hypothetical protein n=1 Tax=Crocosphaera sp. TaxID=2729996 RepID=UPI0026170ED6|nr:hypothetical protein [Crocosphaera sp.]MDJ0582919.1 hypothetical protein [Crocosphaera sp.]